MFNSQSTRKTKEKRFKKKRKEKKKEKKLEKERKEKRKKKKIKKKEKVFMSFMSLAIFFFQTKIYMKNPYKKYFWPKLSSGHFGFRQMKKMKERMNGLSEELPIPF